MGSPGQEDLNSVIRHHSECLAHQLHAQCECLIPPDASKAMRPFSSDDPNRYLLVYGRRRLEAIRATDKVAKVRARVATLDDDNAVRTQISENMAQRDLSFIEKALFAQELVETGCGNQSQVAEVLTVTKSSISMAIAIAGAVGADLARAIGPAPGVGRPRWETLAKANGHFVSMGSGGLNFMAETALDRTRLDLGIGRDFLTRKTARITISTNAGLSETTRDLGAALQMRFVF